MSNRYSRAVLVLLRRNDVSGMIDEDIRWLGRDSAAVFLYGFVRAYVSLMPRRAGYIALHELSYVDWEWVAGELIRDRIR